MICDNCKETMELIKDGGFYEIWQCKKCGKKIEIDINNNMKELED